MVASRAYLAFAEKVSSPSVEITGFPAVLRGVIAPRSFPPQIHRLRKLESGPVQPGDRPRGGASRTNADEFIIVLEHALMRTDASARGCT